MHTLPYEAGLLPPVGGWMVVTLTFSIEKNETMLREQLVMTACSAALKVEASASREKGVSVL